MVNHDRIALGAAFVAIVAAMVTGVPASAMEIPLTPAGAKAAIAAGTAHKVVPAAYAAGGEWMPKSDGGAADPVGASLTVESPFELLYFTAADAAAHYREVDPAAIKEALAMRTLKRQRPVF